MIYKIVKFRYGLQQLGTSVIVLVRFSGPSSFFSAALQFWGGCMGPLDDGAEDEGLLVSVGRSWRIIFALVFAGDLIGA